MYLGRSDRLIQASSSLDSNSNLPRGTARCSELNLAVHLILSWIRKSRPLLRRPRNRANYTLGLHRRRMRTSHRHRRRRLPMPSPRLLLPPLPPPPRSRPRLNPKRRSLPPPPVSPDPKLSPPRPCTPHNSAVSLNPRPFPRTTASPRQTLENSYSKRSET